MERDPRDRSTTTRRARERDDDPRAAKARRRGRYAAWALVAIVWLYALAGPEGLLVQWRRGAEYEVLRAELERQRAETERLREFERGLREDPLVMEREIRRHLDFQREGEIVFVLGDEDPLKTGERAGE